MIYALYRGDPGTNQITGEKIGRTIRRLHSNPQRGGIIIFEEGTAIIGYSILIFYWSNEFGGDILHIDELYVKPEYRERGAATSFLKHILQAFKNRTVALQLEVTSSNTRAMNYYQKLGFKKTLNLHLIRTIRPTRHSGYLS
jgi:ribosomal protein S18 acetylase RimI-like enzyme